MDTRCGRSTIQRLVLWSADRTLVDVGRVAREAYAQAFEQVVGKPMARVAPMTGRTDSEVIFETLALHGIEPTDHHLPEFSEALAAAFAARKDAIKKYGRVLPGAKEAVTALKKRRDAVQTVLTGTIEPNARLTLATLGLGRALDLDVGGYGSENFPKSSLLQVAQARAAEKYSATFDQSSTVLITESPRDVQAARIGGAIVIGVVSGVSTEAELHDMGADLVLDDLHDTTTLVNSIDQLTDPTNGSPAAGSS